MASVGASAAGCGRLAGAARPAAAPLCPPTQMPPAPAAFARRRRPVGSVRCSTSEPASLLERKRAQIACSSRQPGFSDLIISGGAGGYATTPGRRRLRVAVDVDEGAPAAVAAASRSACTAPAAGRRPPPLPAPDPRGVCAGAGHRACRADPAAVDGGPAGRPAADVAAVAGRRGCPPAAAPACLAASSLAARIEVAPWRAAARRP